MAPKDKSALEITLQHESTGTLIGDCLLYATDGEKKVDVVRGLETFSTASAHPAQLLAGFTVQVLLSHALPRP